MRGHRDLEIVAGASALCAVAALVLPFEAVRLVFAAPLALFLPGYALTAAAFAQRPLELPQLLLLSVALSLATLALGALLLDFAPGGVRAVSWALLLLLVVLGGCGSAALRRPPPPAGPGWPRPRLAPTDGALLLGGLATAAAALALAGTLLPANDVRGYTQLWMLPLRDGREAGVRVGVTNEETSTVAYSLRTRIHEIENVVRSFSLAPGETRIVRVRADPPPPPGRSVPAVATLFRESRPDTVYRRVSGWVSAPEAAG